MWETACGSLEFHKQQAFKKYKIVWPVKKEEVYLQSATISDKYNEKRNTRVSSYRSIEE